MICNAPNIEALIIISLPVDLEGNAFFLHNFPFKHEQCDLEFYHCTNCSEQFRNWDEAEEHKNAAE